MQGADHANPRPNAARRGSRGACGAGEAGRGTHQRRAGGLRGDAVQPGGRAGRSVHEDIRGDLRAGRLHVRVLLDAAHDGLRDEDSYGSCDAAARRVGRSVKTLLFDALGARRGRLAVRAWRWASCCRSSRSTRPRDSCRFAFPIGSQRIVTWESVVIAVGAGALAACIGVLTPVRDIWARVAYARDIP